MGKILLIDTDSLLGLSYSAIGQFYMENAKRLRITAGVKNELDYRIGQIETKQAAKKAEECLRNNPNIDLSSPVTQNSVSHNSGEDTQGEQSIHDYIIFGQQSVEVVLFFDSDMNNIMSKIEHPPPRFDVVSSIFTYLGDRLTKEQKITETLKIAKGRSWTSKRNFRDLFVESGILTESEFNYDSLKKNMNTADHDLPTTQNN